MLEKETGNTFNQIMAMDYIIFNCHLYWIQQLNLESYMDQMSLLGLSNTPACEKNQHITKPDLKAIKRLGGGI